MLCAHWKGVQGPTGTRGKLRSPHFARDTFINFDQCGYGFRWCCSAAAAVAKARLLLLLMLSVIGKEAARHAHCSMVSTFAYDKPEFCLFSACRCCCCPEVHDTLQYHSTSLMSIHSLSVLCQTLMRNGLALVHS